MLWLFVCLGFVVCVLDLVFEVGWFGGFVCCLCVVFCLLFGYLLGVACFVGLDVMFVWYGYGAILVLCVVLFGCVLVIDLFWVELLLVFIG